MKAFHLFMISLLGGAALLAPVASQAHQHWEIFPPLPVRVLLPPPPPLPRIIVTAPRPVYYETAPEPVYEGFYEPHHREYRGNWHDRREWRHEHERHDR
jgi:hypothetical protein